MNQSYSSENLLIILRAYRAYKDQIHTTADLDNLLTNLRLAQDLVRGVFISS